MLWFVNGRGRKPRSKKKVHIGEEEVKHWQNVVYYFMDGLLQTLSHIITRLIKSSLDLLLYKTLYIIFIFFEQKICGKVKHELRVQMYDLRVQTSYKFESTNYEFKSSSYEFKSTSYEFRSTNYEFKPTCYEFKATSYEFKSRSLETKNKSWKIKSTSWAIKSTS